MPRSRSRSNSKNKQKSSSGSVNSPFIGRRPAAKWRRSHLIISVLGGVVAIGAIGAYWLWSSTLTRNFAALAAEGQSVLSKVETEFSQGQAHVPLREAVYADTFPLSGSHHRVPIKPGFYNRPQPPAQLVHSIEHGNIAIYYDKPDEAALGELKRWANFYSGTWDGVVVTPMPGLSRKIVLTAWTKRLTLDRFDAASVAAFIDAYRGRGPENPVR
jgi:hypothetical protein